MLKPTLGLRGMASPLTQLTATLFLLLPGIVRAECVPSQNNLGLTCRGSEDSLTLNSYESLPGSLDQAQFIFDQTTVESKDGQSMFGKNFTGTTGNAIHFIANKATFNGNGHFINVYQSHDATYEFNDSTFNFHSTPGYVFNFYAGASANNTSLLFNHSTINLAGTTYGLALLTGAHNVVSLTDTTVNLAGGAVGISFQGSDGVVVLKHSAILSTRNAAISSNTYGFKEFDIIDSALMGDNDAGAIDYDSLDRAIDQATDITSTVRIINSTITSNRANALHLAAPNNLVDEQGRNQHIYDVLIDHAILTGEFDTISDHVGANHPEPNKNIANKQFNLTIQNHSAINAPLGADAISLISPANVTISNSNIHGNINLQGGDTDFALVGGQLSGAFTMGKGVDRAYFINTDTSEITEFNGGAGDASLHLVHLSHTGGADIVNWSELHVEQDAALTLNSNLVLGNAGGQGVLPAGSGTLELNAASLYVSDNAHPIITAFDASQPVTVLNAGVIDLRHNSASPGTHTLTIRGHYVGQGGLLSLNTFIAGDTARTDTLIIDGQNGGGSASGATLLDIHYIGRTGGMTRGDGIPVVLAINQATTTPNAFVLNDSIRAGAYDFRLLKGGLNPNDTNLAQSWFIRSSYYVPSATATSSNAPSSPAASSPAATEDGTGPTVAATTPATTASAALPTTSLQPIVGPELSVYGSAIPVAQNMNVVVISSLHQRVGEEYNPLPLAAFGDFFNGIWLRAFGESYKDEYASIVNPTASGSVIGGQIGGDIFRWVRESGARDYAGVYFAYARDHSNISGLVTNLATTLNFDQPTGSMDINGKSGGVYWTHFWANGPYLDIILQDTQYQGNATSSRGGIGLNGYGLAASLESGFPFHFFTHWLLEPELQLLAQRVQLQKTNDYFSSIDLGTNGAALGRLGARLQYSAEIIGCLLQPYLLANVWSTLGGARTTTVYAGVDSIVTKAAPAWTEVGAGMTAVINKRISVYGNVNDVIALNHQHQQHSAIEAAVGIRVNW